MKIHYKGLIHDRFEDAPWLGTLWIAPDCKHSCLGCCNQHLLSTPTLYHDVEDIVKEVKSDIFSEGIILAGLDPLTYPEELLALIRESLRNDLKIILYTQLPDRESLIRKVPDLDDYKGIGILVKYGRYDETKRVYNYWDHGVRLSTSNQYISEL